jgi:3-deoxy-D-manno-octulosonic-acid transferase
MLTGGVQRRSRQQMIGGASVYLADTLGEMGTLYALAPVALVAGSLSPHLKGHNPIEPAKLGSAIVTGPYVESFEDVFGALFAAGAALKAADATGLAAAVAFLWRDETARQSQLGAARAIAAQGAEAFEETVAQLAAMAPTQAEVAHAPA